MALTARSCWSFVALTALAAAACSNDSVPPGPPGPSPVALVEIEPRSVTLVWGQQTALKAVVKDASGRILTDREVTWASSDPTRVTVTPWDSDRLSASLNPVALGTATITATVEGESGHSAVAVRLPDGLFAWPDTSRIPVSATRRLTLRPSRGYHVAGTVYPVSSWETSDPSVAMVNSDGRVTAVGVGHATITGRADGRHFTAEVFTFRYPAPLRFASVSSDAEHTCALTTDGVTYCWGLNNAGQLGNDEIMDRCAAVATTAGFLNSIRKFRCSESPIPVSTDLRFASVSVGAGTSCALTMSGSAYCWGHNRFGNTGTGVGDTIVRVPTRVAGGITFRMVDVTGYGSCGVSTQNVAYCWGFNVLGSLGNGSRDDSPTPTRVAGDLSWSSVSAGATACGTTTAGVAYCWGSNRTGQAGVPREQWITTPARVVGDLTFSRVEAGSGATCGLVADGRVYCWGDQRGPDPTMTHVPKLVPGDVRFASLHVRGGPCALTADGATYCWNALRTIDGQYETPVPSKPSFPLRTADFGGVSCGIDLSGILYCWGGPTTISSAFDRFWTLGGLYSGSSGPARVAGQ